MKVSFRTSSFRTNSNDEKIDYLNFSQTRIITLFQVPHYEHLQILICNGNSLTTLAGVENIKHLWKLDVSNNQIRSLQHLSRFIAFGSLILSNNNLSWIELQHIRHMFILDLRLDGNPLLDLDSNYRQHVLDCLPRVWMFDGIFVSTAERNEVDEFFTQSSLSSKPVRRKLARDIFMPTNLRDRSVNGLFGTKATELFAKFPMNCFINPELDRKRIKHLASTTQDILFTEMKYKPEKDSEQLLNDNRHILHHMIDLRQTHTEQFNMLLILLTTDILFQLPVELLDDIFNVTRIKTIGALNLFHMFAAGDSLKFTIASLIHAAARVDRDENHPTAFYDKLFQSISLVLTNQVRKLTNASPMPGSMPIHLNTAVLSEAKTLVCLEVMQVFIMCPVFYTLFDNPNVNSILKQALDRSAAYGSIKDILENLQSEQKPAEEQRDLLCPMLANILKTAIRTLLSKRTKKMTEPIVTVVSGPPTVEIPTPRRNQHENETVSLRPMSRSASRRVPAIGDRILTGPQSIGRIVTLPDSEIAMVQLDHVLAPNGSMISNGTLTDHTTYVTIKEFEWSPAHEYWKLKYSPYERVTLQMTTAPFETPRATVSSIPFPSPTPVQVSILKTPDSSARPSSTLKQTDISAPKEKELPPEPARIQTPPPVILVSTDQQLQNNSEVFPSSPPPTPPPVEKKVNAPDQKATERPMSVRITKQQQDKSAKSSFNGETYPNPPVLIESTLLLVPDQSQSSTMAFEKPKATSNHFSTTAPELDTNRSLSFFEQLSPIPSIVNHQTPIVAPPSRIHVPVHNASQWFNGPDLKNERTGRMEKVVASLLRRSFRPTSNYGMPRVPVLSSPSSRDHAYYRGGRPGSFQDFRLESQRVTPVSGMVTSRQSTVLRGRPSASPIQTFSLARPHHDGYAPSINRVRSLLNPSRTTPT